jgi:hypothetical protein
MWTLLSALSNDSDAALGDEFTEGGVIYEITNDDATGH